MLSGVKEKSSCIIANEGRLIKYYLINSHFNIYFLHTKCVLFVCFPGITFYQVFTFAFSFKLRFSKTVEQNLYYDVAKTNLST